MTDSKYPDYVYQTLARAREEGQMDKGNLIVFSSGGESCIIPLAGSAVDVFTGKVKGELKRNC